MARICFEYECEVQESQRKPFNLLDALERGDHCSGEDNDAVVGEEKVACYLWDTVACPFFLTCPLFVLGKREGLWKKKACVLYTVANLTVVNVWYSPIFSKIHTVYKEPMCEVGQYNSYWCHETTMLSSIVHFLLKANRLSTLSLQHDKRMDDELRGVRRKIKLVQEQVHIKLTKGNRFLWC